MWPAKHAPRTRDDLAVNKKKVTEVSEWMDESFRGLRGLVSILLMTGEPGIGKTATVQVLAREKNVNIVEWSNPNSFSSEYSTDFRPGSDFRLNDSSQSSQFSDFLLRVERYPTLSFSDTNSSSRRKVLLIEEFPNAFLHNYSSFHDCLRKFSRLGNSGGDAITPVIFIVSGSSGGSSATERGLFPESFQAELRIHCIRFNPVAATAMMKALTRVVTSEGAQSNRSKCGLVMPDAATLQEIAATSPGDIRSAINSLQFSVLGQNKNSFNIFGKNTGKMGSGALKRTRNSKSTKINGKEVKNSKNESKNLNNDISGKDTSLSLFHALGKLFYCKRLSQPDSTKESLPQHLAEFERDSLVFDPESVIDKVAISSEYFLSFIHQNYVDFYTKIEDVAEAADCLSWCDDLVCDWSTRQVLREYSSSIGSRSIAFYNSARSRADAKAPSIGWKPLHRPQSIDVAKRMTNNHTNMTGIFSMCDSGLRLSGGSRAVLESLPYIEMISSAKSKFSTALPSSSKFPTSLNSGKYSASLSSSIKFSSLSGVQPSLQSDPIKLSQRQLTFLRDSVSLARTRNSTARLEKLDEHTGQLLDDDDDDMNRLEMKGSGTTANNNDDGIQQKQSEGSSFQGLGSDGSLNSEGVAGSLLSGINEAVPSTSNVIKYDDDDEVIIEDDDDD